MAAQPCLARGAHRPITFYIAVVLAAAWLWMLSIKLGFRPKQWVWITVLMWIPGLASILFRLLFREGFADVGWRIGKVRFWAWAYLGPLGLASLSVLIALLLGKVRVAPDLSHQTMLEAVFFKLSWLMRDASVGSLLIQRFLAVALISIGPGFFCAFGEELGWRGYLLPRLMQAGGPSPLLLSGVVWGIWHSPLFVFTGYAHGAVTLSLIMFILLTALFGVFIGWLRLASGSVFVAAMAHLFQCVCAEFLWPFFRGRWRLVFDWRLWGIDLGFLRSPGGMALFVKEGSRCFREETAMR
jgi:membrane protease YdiL (CAAX protease family)